MNDFDKITPQQRALLESVAMPDLPGGKTAPIKLTQSNSLSLMPGSDNYLPGAVPGGYVVPGREGPLFMPVPPGFHTQPIGFRRQFVLLEMKDGDLEPIGDPLPEPPKDARWRDDLLTGKRVYRTDAGLVVREEVLAFLWVEETGQLGCYTLNKTALKIGREFGRSSSHLKVEGLPDSVMGCILGRYLMTSRLEKDGDRRWFLPVWQLVGKLGQPNGPTLEAVLKVAELRKIFMAGLPPVLEASQGVLEIEGPPAPPPEPGIDEPLDGPPEPPPYERNPDDDIDFGP